jgi:GAF domain-containing protein
MSERSGRTRGGRAAPLPSNEAARLAVLRALDVLDTPPDASLDDLTRLASRICETPIALISLIDERRQWFKSRVGLDVPSTDRDVAFCAHAILEPDVMLVPDAIDDERFADNPLVTGDPKIRLYAGAPLLTRDGYALGTLCVIDRTPRRLDEGQIEALRILAQQIVTQLELRQALRQTADALQELKTLGGLLPICASCKKIRDDEGYWQRVEAYLSERSDATFTHGLCPACLARIEDDLDG